MRLLRIEVENTEDFINVHEIRDGMEKRNRKKTFKICTVKKKDINRSKKLKKLEKAKLWVLFFFSSYMHRICGTTWQRMGWDQIIEMC